MKKSREEKVKSAEDRLAALRIEVNKKKRQEKLAAAKAERRKKFAEAYALTRQGDAHRKIELGGVVIAAGADHLDPAELCGLLLLAMKQTTPERLEWARKQGLDHFEARKAARGEK